MGNVDYHLLNAFNKKPKNDRIRILKQNLELLEQEEAVDVSDLIELCHQRIAEVKQERRT